MTWHGQINRTIWEISEAIKKNPEDTRHRRELLRAQFLQQFEHDKALHVPRDDRTFMFLHEGEGPVVLLLHGSAGTPAEFRELGNHLYAHGISVYCPRLTRETGRNREATWESWVTQSQIALEAVTTCSPMPYVCGLSLGGTVAMILRNQIPVKGVILLAPALFPRLSLKARVLQVARAVTPTVFYHFAGWNGEVLRAMEYARRNAGEIDVPLLALQAADDNRLSPRGLKLLRRHAKHSDTEVRLLDAGSHVLTRGASKDEVFNAVAAFVDRGSRAAGWTPPRQGSGEDARSDPS
ncbi:MAG TPA: alpha/beta fold hydrolase [Candidatus Krumholzibacteria bacterium]|nr:alpha/beta fold hydrolase [Candidatus Krumholzibacteria bacterium]